MAIISVIFPATFEFSANIFNNILKNNRQGLTLIKFFLIFLKTFLQEERGKQVAVSHWQIIRQSADILKTVVLVAQESKTREKNL